jgi:hypothetical protein
MSKVFVVQHAHTHDDDVEEIKFIGVYSTRENAQAAVARLSRQPGFADTPDGFHVDEYRVDQDQWAEGYATVANA